MSLLREYELLIEQIERQIDEQVRRIIRLKHEVNQKATEQAELEDSNAEKEEILKKLRKEQWKEEDKVINKIRLQGVISEEGQTQNRKRTCR